MKIKNLFLRIAQWQPKPFIAKAKSNNLSIWFYKKKINCENSYVRNSFGQKWQDFFCWLSK